MKKYSTITILLAAIGAVAVAKFIVDSIKTKHMLKEVANEGYETASDILYPDKNLDSNNLHYGPVIPVL